MNPTFRPQSSAQAIPSPRSLGPAYCLMLVSLLAAVTGCAGSSGSSGGNTSGLTSTTTTLTASSTSVGTGGTITLTATVSPSAATGTVTFYENTAQLGSATLTAGVATYIASFTTAGTYSITATYAGSSSYSSSPSPTVTVTVTTSPVSTIGAGGASTIYAMQTAQGPSPTTILDWPATANGLTAPAATLAPPTSLIADSMCTDLTGNVYIAGSASQSEILEYASGATGSATPIRTILEPAGDFDGMDAITVDSAGQIYVATYNSQSSVKNSIQVLSASATGLATPVRQIIGSATGLTQPLSMAVDSSGTIYYLNQPASTTSQTGQILVFAPGANGNVAPTRIITTPTLTFGLAVDTSGNLYTGETTLSVSGTTQIATGSIVEFGPTASGAATPIKTITGSNTALQFIGDVRRDSVGNLYVLNALLNGSTNISNFTYAIESFGYQATGNVAPATTVTSSAFTFAGNDIAIH